MRLPVTVGIVGLGEGGRRFAETLDGLRDCELNWLCDGRTRIPDWTDRFPRATTTRSLDDLLDDDRLDAVVVAGDLQARGGQIAAALAAGKHVLVDGPVSTGSDEAFELARRARASDRCLVAESTMLFDAGLRKLKELIATGQLGDVLHVYVNNQRFGDISEDCDVLWSLGPREVGAILYLLDDVPVQASAWGESYLRPELPDVVYGFLRFATGITAHLHLSWLDPQHLHRLAVAGSGQMAVYDSAENDCSLTLVEHQIGAGGRGEERIRLQPGGRRSPLLPVEDGFAVLAETFLSSVRRGRPVEAAMGHAINVTSTLEALQASVDAGGAPYDVALPLPRLGNVIALNGGAEPVRTVR
jgi:predicted dehydrogenase